MDSIGGDTQRALSAQTLCVEYEHDCPKSNNGSVALALYFEPCAHLTRSLPEAVKKLLDQNITQVTEICRLKGAVDRFKVR